MRAHAFSIEALLARDRLVVGAGLLALTVASWAYVVHDARSMHCAAMGMAASWPQQRLWAPIEVWLLFVMWAVMMVAMMVPSVAPMALMFAAVSRQRQRFARPFVPTSIFVVGYLVVWTIFSALAAAGQWGFRAAALLSASMMLMSPAVSGGLLILAGVFQLTSLKQACLSQCRTPLDFLMTEWREGRWGAFVMGLRHGAYCLGCCWLLMLVLFVAGVMNLAWVAMLSVVVLIEKVAPAGPWISRCAGVLLASWGASLLAMSR